MKASPFLRRLAGRSDRETPRSSTADSPRFRADVKGQCSRPPPASVGTRMEPVPPPACTDTHQRHAEYPASGIRAPRAVISSGAPSCARCNRAPPSPGTRTLTPGRSEGVSSDAALAVASRPLRASGAPGRRRPQPGRRDTPAAPSDDRCLSFRAPRRAPARALVLRGTPYSVATPRVFRTDVRGRPRLYGRRRPRR